MIQLNRFYDNFPVLILGYELKDDILKVFLKNISETNITKIKIKYIDEIYEIDNLNDNINKEFSVTIERKRKNIIGEIEIISINIDDKEIKPQGKTQTLVKAKSINFLGREKYLFIKDVLKTNDVSKSNIKYMPYDGGMYWNCLCGETNFNACKCAKCGVEKEKALSVKKDYTKENDETNQKLKIRLNIILWLVVIYGVYIACHILTGDFLLVNDMKNNVYGVFNRFIAPFMLIISSVLSFLFLNYYKTKESKICEIIKLVIVLYLNVISMIKTLETAYNGLFQIGIDILFAYELIALHISLEKKYIVKEMILAVAILCGLISFGKMINYSKYDLELNESGLKMTIKTDKTELTIPDKLDGLKITGISFLEDYDYKIEVININKYLETININSNAILPNLKEVTVKENEKMYVKEGVLYNISGKTLLIPHSATSITFDKEVIERFSVTYALGLEEIYIKKTVKKIELQAFEGCENLKRIIFEEESTLEVIEDNAFSGCTSLESFELPISVQELGDGVLRGCNNVKEVKIPFVGNKREDNPNNLFAGDLFVKLFGGTIAIQNYLIPETLEKIEVYDVAMIHNGTFYMCENVKEIVLPEEMTYMGVNVFYGCKSLTKLIIPEGIETIGSSTFEGCINLKEIVIPSSVKVICENAFKGCENLEKAIYEGNINDLEIREGNEILDNLIK